MKWPRTLGQTFQTSGRGKVRRLDGVAGPLRKLAAGVLILS